MGCSGNCAHCSGCARELVLTREEIGLLEELGQIPFLPVARKLGDLTPIYLENGDQEENSLLLQVLEKKGLISLDFDKPLKNADYGPYAHLPIHGSMALTNRGQQVLEVLDLQGAEEI